MMISVLVGVTRTSTPEYPSSASSLVKNSFNSALKTPSATNFLFLETCVAKKRKFVADGVFKAELNEFLTRELAEDGYSGVEVRVTPTRTEIIIMATRTQNVLGGKGRRIRELTSVVQKTP